MKVMKKIASIVMALGLTLIAIPLIPSTETKAAANDEKPGTINLTVGNELVGADADKWEKSGDNYSYAGNGYSYIKTGDDSGKLVLNGGTFTGYYQFNYKAEYVDPVSGETSEDIERLYETPGVITVNYVKDNTSQPEEIKDLVIDVQDDTTLSIAGHDPSAKIDYAESGSSYDAYGIGVYTYDELEERDIPLTITILNGTLTITASDVFDFDNMSGIKAKTLNIGDNNTPADIEIKNLKMKSESKSSYVIGIASYFDSTQGRETSMEVRKGSKVTIENLDSTGFYGTAHGIDSSGILVEEGAVINVGAIKSTTYCGFPIGAIETSGISSRETDLINKGTINVGLDGKKIQMIYERTGVEGEDDSYKAAVTGISAPAAGIENYGSINVEGVELSFTTDAMGDLYNSMVAGINGIYSQFYFRTYKGSSTVINKEDTMSLFVDAPACDVGAYYAHGLQCQGTKCEISADDSVIFARAGKVKASSEAGSKGSAMGICGTIIEATGASEITGIANKSETFIKDEDHPKHPFSNNDITKHGISTIVLYAHGTSKVLGDARLTVSDNRDNGKGIEISGDELTVDVAPAFVYDNAVLEGVGSYNNAIWGVVDHGEGYSPKVEYGESKESAKVIYSLTGGEYAKNSYARISNYKSEDPVNPPTGDFSNMGLYLILGIFSTLVLSGIVFARNKKKSN